MKEKPDTGHLTKDDIDPSMFIFPKEEGELIPQRIVS